MSMAFAGASGMALAGPVEMYALAQYSLGGVAQPDQRSPSSGFDSTAVDVLFGDSDGSGNNVFFHPYGYNSGGFSFFGSRASGGGVFDAKSTFHLQQEYTATGPLQQYMFNFVVDNGELSADCGPCTGGGSATLDIKIGLDADNNGSIDQTFLGNASLLVNGDGSYTFSRTGLAADLAGIPGDSAGGPANPLNAYFGWGATPMSLNLGNFSNGQTFRLEYDLIAHATGNFTAGSTLCYGETNFNEEFPDGENPINVAGGGEAAAAAVGEGGFFCTGWLPGTGARAGDPGGIPDGSPFGITGSAVPEPASTSLLGLGLGAALLAGRRRKKQSG
ncbi:MAG: PEP-CTERM sorting domain-containing protein [Burkholderiales bacterium]|nr:PEP-CTERM sorting domain-containing protein [Burkholderiales bacterium]